MPAVAQRGADRELRYRSTGAGPVPQRTPGILAVFAQRIKTQIDSRQPLQIVIEIPRQPLQGIENGLFRRHPVPCEKLIVFFPLDDDVVVTGNGLFELDQEKGYLRIMD